MCHPDLLPDPPPDSVTAKVVATNVAVVWQCVSIINAHHHVVMDVVGRKYWTGGHQSLWAVLQADPPPLPPQGG